MCCSPVLRAPWRVERPTIRRSSSSECSSSVSEAGGTPKSLTAALATPLKTITPG
jgi:hypothetical protein